jgi:hypothetical protein
MKTNLLMMDKLLGVAPWNPPPGFGWTELATVFEMHAGVCSSYHFRKQMDNLFDQLLKF